MTIEANTPHVFRPSRNWKLFRGIYGVVYLFGCVFFIFEYISSLQKGSSDPFRQICFFPWFIFFCLWIAFLGFYDVLRARLIISPHGLEYHAGGVDAHVKWDEIAESGSYRWLFSRRTGLSVRSDHLIKGWLGSLTLPIQSKVRKLIPLSIFEQDWQNGAIGLRIKAYAPDILENKHQ